MWNPAQLAEFLETTKHHRLHLTLHLAAFTGMRRGEVAGLRWADWNETTHRLSINRSRQVVAGRSTEFAPKTRTSRRCIDLDPATEQHLRIWRTRQQDDGHPAGPDDAIFTNTAGEALHAESISQLFTKSSPAPPCRESDCTIFATPTRRFSSRTGFRSRSCPNGSATHTPVSPWPPTNTCCPA